jgi:hypothetical protein
MMTKYQQKTTAKPRFSLALIDDLYHSCSLEFWLLIATVGIAADWIFKFGTESLVVTLVWAGILGTYIFSTSRMANRFWSDLRSLRAPRHLGLWLAGLAVLATLFFVNALTDPAHALIITNSGVTAISTLLSGTAAAPTTAGSTATAGATGLVATNTGLTAFAGMVITLIKVIFALAFIFGIYSSYQKYNERAELQEIVQGPIVLIIAVLAIDGILGMIFGTT